MPLFDGEQEFRFSLTVDIDAGAPGGRENLNLVRKYVITAPEVRERFDKLRGQVGPGNRPGDEVLEMVEAICNDTVDDVERFVITRVNGLA